MKKIALLSLAALAMPAAAFAAGEDMTTTPSAATPSASAGGPATQNAHTGNGMATAPKKVALKEGTSPYKYAMVEPDGTVKVTKDGSSWMAAPDGTWTASDGSTLKTMGGKKQS